MAEQRRERAARPPGLGRALRNVLADRRWPLKVLVGGALATSLLGLAAPQGFLIESIDNTRRGFATPLPIWRDWGTKLVLGLLALVIDFTYFVFPQMLFGVLFFCGAAFQLLAGGSGTTLILIPVALAACWVLAAFSLGLSPIGKLIFAEEGDLARGISREALHAALRTPGRGLYARARIASLPVYLPALGAALLFWRVISTTNSLLLALLTGWLLSSALFFAHLVVVQLYAATAEVVRKAEFEARLATRERTLRRG